MFWILVVLVLCSRQPDFGGLKACLKLGRIDSVSQAGSRAELDWIGQYVSRWHTKASRGREMTWYMYVFVVGCFRMFELLVA